MTAVPAPDISIATFRSGAVAEIRIGDGSRRNALPGAAWARLARQVGELGACRSLRVLVIRGHGDTFCAGSDLTDWVDAEPGYVEESFAHMEEAFSAIEDCPVPVIAEIHGVAAGAGCQLALACDLRLMADSARIGMPIARLGILASPAFAARMVAVAGPSVARELLYTGRLVDARTAVALGLADHQVPAAQLTDRTGRLTAAIAEQPPAAIRAAKLAVGAVLGPQRTATAVNPRPAVARSHFGPAIAAFLGPSAAAAPDPPLAP
ncbi:enoyl-CoA hydratase/isomerase family protein [Streptomyces platensis]|uniref:Carnitinyl-CoA dehydratase n=1 Tax=Streptomyces platensis TaxID=58346 RepID=A0AAE6NIS8_STRPT|nr:enoyl-CoA hydratase/isomerase family protein [Streptomyces platensis]OSY35633.1 Carnitinyl-CoA dehydratase [Streptomyces platensis]QEV52296.1 enoyl-CoA hydratase/isomerase family protein [Streptomyces platensis]